MLKSNSSLQSIRFIAAIMIFLRHWVFFNIDPEYTHINSRVFSFFYSPLTFFFILSGWSLTNKYYEQIHNHTFKLDLYWRKRLLRFYPLHIVTTTFLYIPLNWPNLSQLPVSVYISNIFLVHGFIPLSTYYRSLSGISWCLSIFLLWYLIFPIIMLVLARFDSYIRKYASVLALCMLSGLGVWIYRNTFETDSSYALYFSPYARLIDCMIGVCLFFMSKKIEKAGKMTGLRWTFVEGLVICVVIAFQWFAPYVATKYTYDLYFIVPWGAVVGVFAVSRGYVSRILSWRPMTILGSISLEFFLVHIFSLGFIFTHMSPIINMSTIQKLIASFLLTIVCSFFLRYVLIRQWYRVRESDPS